MKKIQVSLMLVLFIALCGCATPKKTAYTTLAAIGVTVDKAMQGAAEAKIARKLDDTQWAEIVTVHRKWQASYNLAVDLAAQDYTKFAPSDVIALQVDLIEIINKFSK